MVEMNGIADTFNSEFWKISNAVTGWVVVQSVGFYIAAGSNTELGKAIAIPRSKWVASAILPVAWLFYVFLIWFCQHIFWANPGELAEGLKRSLHQWEWIQYIAVTLFCVFAGVIVWTANPNKSTGIAPTPNTQDQSRPG